MLEATQFCVGLENKPEWALAAQNVEAIKRANGGSKMTTFQFMRKLRDFGAECFKARAKMPKSEEGGERKQYDLWVLPYNKHFWLQR